MKFIWNAKKNSINKSKHGITFEEAAQVFLDVNYVIKYDEDHSDSEDRFEIIGITEKGLLFVVFVEKIKNEIRIISACKAIKKERTEYEQKNRT